MSTEHAALLRNMAWVAAAGYVESAVGLLAGVLIARTLGPSDYGHYAYGIWLCGALIAACNHGLPTTSIKFIAEVRGGSSPGLATDLVAYFMRLQTISSVLVVGAFVCAMLVRPIADWLDQLPLMLALASVAVWSRSSFWMWGSIGEGFEVFAPANLSLMMVAALNVLGVLAVAFAGGSVAQFFGLYAALGVVSNLSVQRLLRSRGIRSAPGPIPDDLRKRVRRHLVLTGAMILITILTNRGVEMSLLKWYSTPEAVGYFAIAGSLTRGAVMLIAGGMAAVLLPAMSRRFGAGGSPALAGILRESARVYWLIGLTISGLGLAVSEGVIHLLYGQRYEGAIPALTWSLVMAGPMAINGAAAAALSASDRQIDRIRASLFTLVLNAAAGVLLIPPLGLTGAIISAVVAQLAEMCLTWFYALRRVSVRLPYASMGRQFAAAMIASAAGYEISSQVHLKLSFLAGSAVFLCTYLFLCVVFRSLTQRDFELAGQGIARFGPRAAALARWARGLSRFAREERP